MTIEQRDFAHEFLLKEYENAAQLTFHADELRDKLSTFFLTFAGAAVAAVGLLLQDSFKVEVFGDKKLTAGLFLIGVGIIGVLILCIHARLRRVQLEHFGLISRIRSYCLRDDLVLWNTIQLSPKTLPAVQFRKFSGSELWAMTILLPAAILFATGVDFLLRWQGKAEWWHLIPAGIALAIMVGLWRLFVSLARPPEHSAITEAEVRQWNPALAEGRPEARP